MGFWPDHVNRGAARGKLLQSIINWGLGVVSVYSALFGIGYLLRLEHGIGWALLITSAATLWLMVRRMSETGGAPVARGPSQGNMEAAK